METPTKKGVSLPAYGRAFFLLLLVLFGLWLYRNPQIMDWFAPEAVAPYMRVAGVWAPLMFICAEAIGICLFLPAGPMVILAGALFGPFWGFVYAWIGAQLGGNGAFFIGRSLGRGFVSSMMSKRLKRYDQSIEQNGFAAVLYVRLLNTPFTPVNFAFSLSKVGFKDYLLGTALGSIVPVFVFSFLTGTLREIWITGQWQGLLSPKVILGVALFALSFLLPVIVKRIRLGVPHVGDAVRGVPDLSTKTKRS